MKDGAIKEEKEDAKGESKYSFCWSSGSSINAISRRRRRRGRKEDR